MFDQTDIQKVEMLPITYQHITEKVNNYLTDVNERQKAIYTINQPCQVTKIGSDGSYSKHKCVGEEMLRLSSVMNSKQSGMVLLFKCDEIPGLVAMSLLGALSKLNDFEIHLTDRILGQSIQEVIDDIRSGIVVDFKKEREEKRVKTYGNKYNSW